VIDPTRNNEKHTKPGLEVWVVT